jgi:hypothetical protein
MNNSLIKENFPIFHCAIKVFLLILLLLVLYLSIETVQCIIVYIFKCLKSSLSKVNIMDKLKDLKSSSDGSNLKDYKNPKDPKDPNGMVLSPENKKKNKKKVLDFYGDEVDLLDVTHENKEKAFSLKEMILQKQGTFNKNVPHAKFERNDGLSIKVPQKNWAASLDYQVHQIHKEYDAYDVQADLFQRHVDVIESRKLKNHITVEAVDHILYPAEATTLFKDYVVLVNTLKDNLEPMKIIKDKAFKIGVDKQRKIIAEIVKSAADKAAKKNKE